VARATVCVLAGQEIGIEEALQLRSQGRGRGYSETGFPVRRVR